jgi:hypothetical protein
MIDLSENMLLMIEPQSKIKEEAINDAYTEKMKMLLKKAKKGPPFRGFHVCACGECSTNYDLNIGKYTTNSLAAHYLCYHRSEVPVSEIEKLKKLFLCYK